MKNLQQELLDEQTKQELLSGDSQENQPIDSFTQVALSIQKNARIETQRILRLKLEFDTLIPKVIELIKAAGKYRPNVQRNLDVLYAKCFQGATTEQILAKYNKEDIATANVHRWKKDGAELIEVYCEIGNLKISEELSTFLVNEEKNHYRSSYKTLEAALEEDPVGALRTRVKTVIENILSGCQEISYTEEEVDQLMSRISLAKLNSPTAEGITAYAAVTANHWVLNKISQPEIAARKEAKRLETEQRENTEKEKWEKARDEFLDLMSMVASDEAMSKTIRPHQLACIYFFIFEKETDQQIEERFPGTTRASRDQNRKRGRDFIWPIISDNLKEVLSRYCKSKR